MSIKLAFLLILTTGQRCQIVHALSVENIEIREKNIKIRIGELLKQTNPNFLFSRCFKKIHKHHKKLRQNSKLFIIMQKPYNSASKSTISKLDKIRP